MTLCSISRRYASATASAASRQNMSASLVSSSPTFSTASLFDGIASIATTAAAATKNRNFAAAVTEAAARTIGDGDGDSSGVESRRRYHDCQRRGAKVTSDNFNACASSVWARATGAKIRPLSLIPYASLSRDCVTGGGGGSVGFFGLGSFNRSGCSLSFSSMSHGRRQSSPHGGGGRGGAEVGGGGGGRGFPQYVAWDAQSVLTMRPALPTFKLAGRDGVALDRRGFLILEFVPRIDSGTGQGGRNGRSPGSYSYGRPPTSGSPIWHKSIKFGLSTEEIGLVLDQLPKGAGVELSHRGATGDGGDEEGGYASSRGPVGGYGGAAANNAPDKILRIEPMDHGAVRFEIDHVRDGVSAGEDGDTQYSQVVTVEAGEFEIIRSLLRASIPYLLGWIPMIEMDISHRIALVRSGARGSSGSGRGRNGDFGGGVGSEGEPFF